ncbi:MAG: hypothetical protein DDT19_02811 [Syntrophomonadaceae bacterium]|nr:hypothetical protein [Bacillota bacterium]
MKVFKTQEEVNVEVRDGVLHIDESVVFECPIRIEASICAHNIFAKDITAKDICAMDIMVRDMVVEDIEAENIMAENIKAKDIFATNVVADNITAGDIDVVNIMAININAGDILHQGFCFAYNSITCNSIRVVMSQCPLMGKEGG